ncbi:transposable element Tcb2 transposase [Trichonephila clavipes]|nr:transposable element Tcb2 transposase [Trichonephila clavipes]
MLLARWIVRSVPLEIVESSVHEKVPTCGKPGLERPGTQRGERIEGSCDSSMAGLLPDLSPVEHAWDQLKRQMPSCHSVHDLELAVQDLWAHLPQDNVRCLINSMPDRVAACIAVGGGPTRY